MTTMELIERGIGHNCLSDAYELGRADGYRKAENDYFTKTQKDRENAYSCGYELGKAEAYAEVDNLIAEMTEIAESQMMFRHAEICELIRERIKVNKND